jgi:hypothetical protein
VVKIGAAFVFIAVIEHVAEITPEVIDGALLGVAQFAFDLGDDLLKGVHVGTNGG